MRKWRPSFKSIYVIPEVRGNLASLEVILNRVLPLRKFKGQEDTLIMLGGYIDGDEDGGKVLDSLISIKEEYGDRAIFLIGDHEHMMLKAITGTEKDYQYWIQNGGSTTLTGYLKVARLKEPAASIPQMRLKDIIPNIHIQFLQSLTYTHACEDFFFFHGGWNTSLPLEETNQTTFAFDNTANLRYQRAWRGGNFLDVEKMMEHGKIMVGVHNAGKKAAIYPTYLVLGDNAPQSLLCIDLNSMECVRAKRNKSRIYKTKIRIYE